MDGDIDILRGMEIFERSMMPIYRVCFVMQYKDGVALAIDENNMVEKHTHNSIRIVEDCFPWMPNADINMILRGSVLKLLVPQTLPSYFTRVRELVEYWALDIGEIINQCRLDVPDGEGTKRMISDLEMWKCEEDKRNAERAEKCSALVKL